jgi:hypothetical protein
MRGALHLTVVSGFALVLAACSSNSHDLAFDFPDASSPYPDPSDGGSVTWDSWASGFSNFYCVPCHSPSAPCGGSGCHTPGDPALNSLLFDMRDQSSWTARAATIHCGIVVAQDPSWNCAVAPETYPKTGFGAPLPTDEARGIVAGWIEAGCP